MMNLKKNRILPSIGRRLFSSPYLPRELVGLALGVILTDALLFLMGQPPEYWIDYSYTRVNIPWMQQILATHPLFYLVLTILYSIIIGLFLDGLSLFPSLVLWTMICFLHLKDLLFWEGKVLTRLFSLNGMVEYNICFWTQIVIIGILGLGIVKTLLSHYEAKPESGQLDLKSKLRFSRKIIPSATVIWGLSLIIGLIKAINAPVSGWQIVESEHSPGPRVGAEIAYDIHRGKAVLFGGASSWLGIDWTYENETWEWNGIDWEQVVAETSPPKRGASAMAYDEQRSVVVLFGGENQDGVLADTWEWDGNQWYQRYPTSNPSARGYHKMFYDSQKAKVVLYGGYNRAGTFFDDAWEWDGEQWHPVPIESTSPQASGFVLAYDETNDRAVAFLGGYPGGTWIWRNNLWGRLQLESEPTERTGMQMVYDPINEQFTMFGGVHQEQNLNETWTLNGLSWHKLNTPLRATARWGHAMFYDHNRKRVIIFGGFDGKDYLNDMWELVLLDDD